MNDADVYCHDIEYYKKHKKFYILHVSRREANLRAWNLSDPSYPKWTDHVKCEGYIVSGSKNNLVESTGDILLVSRFVSHHVADDGMVLQADEDP